MKTLPAARFVRLICNGLLGLFLIVASMAHAAVPAMNVTVFDGNSKVAFKRALSPAGAFSTGNLPAGDYVVQFNSNSAELKNRNYLLVVSAGAKKVIADSVSGGQFSGGGVAMRITVGAARKISGQVAPDQVLAFTSGLKTKTIDGKRYVWVKGGLGSNLGDHWEAEGLANAQNVVRVSRDKIQKMQDRGYEGSMLNSHQPYYEHPGHGY
jgi:hypothetical protein